MCYVSNEKSEIKEGYKVMTIDKEGNFYSTFTGQKMGLGKIEKAPAKIERICGYWRPEIYENKFSNDNKFYKPNVIGKTNIFPSKLTAKKLLNDMNGEWIDKRFNLVVVKIIFEGKCYEGTYDWFPYEYDVIAGSNIKSIKIVKN